MIKLRLLWATPFACLLFTVLLHPRITRKFLKLKLLIVLCTATITLTSTVDGRQAACPGEVVTYTCTVTQANILQWVALPFIMSDNTNIPRFLFSAAENTVLDCSNSSSAVQCSEFDYRATLTDVGTVQNGFADMTSTFRFTANARANGTVVECMAALNTGILISNSTLKVAGKLHTLGMVHLCALVIHCSIMK